MLLNTLIRQANLTGQSRDADVDTLISRFVRSVIRLFVFITVLSPAAAGITIQAIATNLMSDASVASKKLATSNTASNGSSSKSAMSNYRAVSISGMLSLVRTSLPVGILPAAAPKDNKKKAINAFVIKCRRIFQACIPLKSPTDLQISGSRELLPERAPQRIGRPHGTGPTRCG